jgi:hypothetical protein
MANFGMEHVAMWNGRLIHRNKSCDIVYMQQSLEVMTAALRVLTALSEKREPDPADIQELEAFIGPKPSNIGRDEWVCDAIQSAIKHRQKVR